MVRRVAHRHLLLQLALVLGVLLSSAPAQAAIMLDGVPSSEYEAFAADPMFASVGWISGYENGSWYTAGSAVLIAPDWVLTAGHCVTRLDDSGWENMRFSLGPGVYVPYTDRAVADAWYVYPGYSGTTPYGVGNDLALIHLSEPIVDVAPAVLFSGEDQRDTLMYMAGYGLPGTLATGLQPFDGKMRAGSSVAEGFGGDTVLTANVETQYWTSSFTPYDSNLQPLEWMGSPGDSGGGWFTDIGGQMQLVGITSGYLDNFGNGTSLAVRTSLYNDWITETMHSVPEPGSCAMLLTLAPIGAWFTWRRGRRNLRRLGRQIVSLAVVLVALFMATPTMAAIMLDGVPSSEYETFAADPMFASVGCLFVNTAGTWRPGSGVLIAPDWILTAGHNIVGTDDLGGGISEVRFYTGASIYDSYDHLVYADSWYVYPGYSGSMSYGHGVDLGLIHLSEPIVDIAPAVLFSFCCGRFLG